MNCNECRYIMFDYIDNKLPVATKMEMETHLNQCAACAEKLARLNEKQLVEEETPLGLFWYLFKPSGGYKRAFLLGAVLTLVFVLYLMSSKLRGLF